MQGEANTPRQYETTLRPSRFLIVDPFTSLLPEVTTGRGMPLVVVSESRRRTERQLFNIIEMVDPLSADYRIVSSVGIWNAKPYSLRILIALLTRCQ